jgi:tetratricopeptide (TPR) repeat protein
MFSLGRLDEAILVLDDPVIRAQDPLASLLLGSCYANLGMESELRATMAAIDPKSPVAPLARAVLLQYDRKRHAVIALAQQMHRTDQDPIWQSLQPVERLLVGDVGGARALLPMQMPGVFMDPPNIAGTHDVDLAIAAQILRQTGSAARADALLVARLSANSQQARQSKDPQILAGRGYVLAAANRTNDALDTFERAFAAGWRLPIEFDYFVRSEDFPFMSAVAATPRWKLLMTTLEKDMAIMRDRVKANNGTTDGAPVAALGRRAVLCSGARAPEFCPSQGQRRVGKTT